MTREETTEFLSKLLETTRLSGIGKYSAKEVSLSWGTKNERRVDYMEFCPSSQICVSDIEKGIFICYEIKSCRQDVFSGNGLNFVGEKNYIVTTMECWKDIGEDYRSGRLVDHIKECNPNNLTFKFGVMVAVPVGHKPEDEFMNPTPLDADCRWELAIAKPCLQGCRSMAMSELLFCMLRSGR